MRASGARLVEQDHFRLDRHGAGDAQSLLLAAGQTEPVGLQLVLDLVPDRGPMQRRFDPLVELGARDLLALWLPGRRAQLLKG